MNTRSQTLRNTAFSSIAVYTEYFLGLLTSILIARDLGPHGFGSYSLVIWMIAVGVVVTNAGTAGGVIKFVAELRGANTPELIPEMLAYLRRAQRWFLAVVLSVAAMLMWLAGERLAPEANHALLYTVLVLAIALRANYMFNVGIAKGFEHFRATAVIATVAAPTNLAMVGVAWWLNAPVEGFLLVFVLSSLLFCLLSWQQTRGLVPARVPGVQMPEVLVARVRRHMLLTAIMGAVTYLTASEVEVLFLTLLETPAEAGQFKVAYQIADGATLLVPGVFGMLLLPMMANALSQGREVAAKRFVGATTYLLLLAMPLLAFGVLFAAPVFAFLYGARYLAAAPAFALILLAKSLSVVSQGGSSLLMSADRQHTVLVIVLVCGLLKIALDVIGIHYFGLHGAVVAYTLATMCTAFAMIGFGIRTSGASLEWGRLLRIVAAGVLALLVALPLRFVGTPLVEIVFGGLLLVVAYALFTLMLGCWNAGDIEHLKVLHRRASASRPRAVARLLDWAERRAPREAA